MLTQAEILNDTLPEDYEMAREVRDFSFCLATMAFEHVPEPCKQNLKTNKSMAQGFFSVSSQALKGEPHQLTWLSSLAVLLSVFVVMKYPT